MLMRTRASNSREQKTAGQRQGTEIKDEGCWRDEGNWRMAEGSSSFSPGLQEMGGMPASGR